MTHRAQFIEVVQAVLFTDEDSGQHTRAVLELPGGVFEYALLPVSGASPIAAVDCRTLHIHEAPAQALPAKDSALPWIAASVGVAGGTIMVSIALLTAGVLRGL